MSERRDDDTLLVIDDDLLFCDSVALHFRSGSGIQKGGKRIRVVSFQRGEEALAWFAENRAEVVLLDQNLPDASGIDICSRLLEEREQVKIIFITAYPSFEHAVEALRRGACDYLSKPMELDELGLSVERAFRTARLERLERLDHYQRRQSARKAVVGVDGGLRTVWELVGKAALSNAPVLITGETGTGKNVIARTIHRLGQRSEQPFVDINCAALPENLIETELFGHEKGAFTGADTRRKGVFELADSGTLFLDEIGDLPVHLQAKLLGVLDDGRFRRVGGEKYQRVDVRIICATNRELEQRERRDSFRQDLFYRLSVLHLHLPPLRARVEDLEDLCREFLRELAPDHEVVLAPGELEKLARYSWPGNVRELKNIIERALILRQTDHVAPSELLGQERKVSAETGMACTARGDEGNHEIRTLREQEKLHISRVLEHFDHNHTRSAKALGISRSTLLRKMERYGLRKSP